MENVMITLNDYLKREIPAAASHNCPEKTEQFRRV